MASRQLNFYCGDVVIAGEQWTTADPSGPPRHVVFLHGGGQTRHSWGATAEKLAARGWTCTTLDLRGHGDSSWSRSADYGLPAHAADLRWVIGELGEGAVLVGASMGGLTALTALAENPELARALVLVDIVPRTSHAGVKRIQAFMTGHLGGFGSLMEASEAVAAYTGRKRRPNPEGMRKNVRLSEDGRWYWHWDPAMMTRADRESGAPDPEHLLRLAAKIKVPVLIVRGALSDVVDASGIEEFQDALQESTVVEVENAGHMVAGDDNDRFADAVGTFLEQLEDAPQQRPRAS